MQTCFLGDFQPQGLTAAASGWKRVPVKERWVRAPTNISADETKVEQIE
jgi:hypothetical protein